MLCRVCGAISQRPVLRLRSHGLPSRNPLRRSPQHPMEAIPTTTPLWARMRCLSARPESGRRPPLQLSRCRRHSGQPRNPPSSFFEDGSGKATSVDVIQSYQSTKIVRPFATADHQVDPKLLHAATIAEERAHAHSRRQCWHAVKDALLASGAISSRPKTEYAKQAGQELVNNYGFRKLPVNDPYQAPVGSVLVYNANRAAGHVEIRTKDGFVSDFRSKTPSHRPLLGVFVKS